MPHEFPTMEEVRFSKADVAACNEHLKSGGARLGCPVCFLRAEYAMRELMRLHPSPVLHVLDRLSPFMRKHQSEEMPS